LQPVATAIRINLGIGAPPFECGDYGSAGAHGEALFTMATRAPSMLGLFGDFAGLQSPINSEAVSRLD
jgi:hypothetical protein